MKYIVKNIDDLYLFLDKQKEKYPFISGTKLICYDSQSFKEQFKKLQISRIKDPIFFLVVKKVEENFPEAKCELMNALYNPEIDNINPIIFEAL